MKNQQPDRNHGSERSDSDSGRPLERVHRVVELSPSDDVRREIDFHLDMRARELVADGWEPAQAAVEARRQFGSKSQATRDCLVWAEKSERARERRDLLGELGRNLRVGLRRFRFEPALTLAAVLTLALGIGANTAIFSFVKGILLDPLPFEEPARLVAMREVAQEGHHMPVSSPNFVDWQQRAKSFEAMALYDWPGGVTLRGEISPVTANAMQVSRDFFRVLGVDVARGRTFGDEDQKPGAAPTVLVSHGFWQSHLQELDLADGPVVEVDGAPFTVIGVLPVDFDLGEEVDLFGPYGLQEDYSSRTAHNYRVIARLGEGVSVEQAQSEMSTIGAVLAEEHAGDISSGDIAVQPMMDDVVGGTSRSLWLLMGAALLVLLVTCANLALGSVAKTLGRSRELAVQAALGAGRGGVIRQLLTESLLLSAMGGVLGLGLAWALMRLLRTSAPADLPRLGNVQLDSGVLLAGVLLATVAGLVLGLLPAFRINRLDLNAALREGGRSGKGGRGRSWTWLVVAEVAVATLLLLGCALFLRSLWGLMTVDKGYDSANVLTLPVVAPYALPEWNPEDMSAWVPFEEQVRGYHQSLLETANTVPGIEHAAIARSIPTGFFGTSMFYADGDNQELLSSTAYLATTADYFSVLQIPLVEGRLMREDDGANEEHVAVVNRAFAERFYKGRQILGATIRPPGMDIHGESWLTIVGVVGDVRHRSLAQEALPHVYVSLRQRPSAGVWSTLITRSSVPAAAVVENLRSVLAERHPELPVEIRSLDELLRSSIARTRFLLQVLLAFAVLATTLVVTGISGVVANAVQERRQELGVRAALGARPRSLVVLVARYSAVLLLIGSAVGLALAFAFGRVLESQLYDVEPTDGATALATVAVLVLFGLLAAAFPALRAARIDPSQVLRES